MKNKIENRIIEIIVEMIELKKEDLNINANLNDEYDMDSAEKAELARILEQEFKVEIERSTRNTWNTTKDIVKFVINNIKN